MPVHDYTPQRIVLLDIDGLRRDAFQRTLAAGQIPNLARLVGGPAIEAGIQFDATSNAPSLTYSCQASSFTGSHPRWHWVPGNMFFDRFGRLTGGKPRKYEFDFVDAPAVFLDGLAGKAIHPQVDTIYETAAKNGCTSTVAFNMYGHGAQTWLLPGLDNWRAFTALNQRGLGEKYDDAMLEDVARHLESGARPDLLTLYFFGLDHESHIQGPEVQEEYLSRIIDRQVGDFLQGYARLGLMDDTLFVIFSDHGQIGIKNDDAHTLKVGFLFDREVGYLFEALGLDVFDHPLEGPHCDALLSPSGGMAQVYLRHPGHPWREPPRFEADVLRLAQAFWDANQTGRYTPDLHGALEMIAVRNVEQQGWHADYQVYTPEGLHPVATYLAQHPEIAMVDADNRLYYLASPVTGDVLLFTRIEAGYNFSLLPYKGTHGSLHAADSHSVLVFSLPQGAPEAVTYIRGIINTDIRDRCRVERGRMPSNVDVGCGIRAVMGWST